MTHPNAQLMRDTYDAFQRGDIAAVREKYFAPEITFFVGGGSPLSGEHRGQAAVFAMLAKVFQLTGGTFKIDIHDITASDDHAIALVNATGTRNGVAGGYRNIHIVHIKDGKIAEWYEQPEIGKFEAFWS